MTLFANRYAPLQLIGSGGFGRVFAVHDRKTGETKAFKWLAGASTESLAQARKEFALLKSLRHSNIGEVHELGLSVENSVEQAYLVSAWIDGENLAQAWSKLSGDDAQILFTQALQGLAYLHENGVLHGDIKPQNLMVTRQTDKITLKIIDFGLAHVQGDTPDIFGGTLEYMAPEIFSENAYSQQSDIYALGICFYKMLTGRFPPENGTAELANVYSNWTAPLGAILTKMIASDTSERYSSVEVILKDVELVADAAGPNTGFSYVLEPFFLRQNEQEQWRNLYEDRFFASPKTTSPIVILWGEGDSGKEKFLKDCLQTAALDLIPIFSLREFQELSSFDDLPQQAIVWAENVDWDEETVSYYETFFADRDYLFLITNEQKNKFLPIKQHIRISKWTEAQTAAYLAKACGRDDLPPSLCQTFFEKTQGSPQALQDCVEGCFARGYLRTETGKWSEKTLADLAGLIELLQDEITHKREPVSTTLLLDSKGDPLSDHDLMNNVLHLRQNGCLDDAKRLLMAWHERPNLESSRRAQIGLEISELDLEMGQIRQARDRLTTGLCNDDFSGEARILAMELLSICDFREHNFESAAMILEEALTVYNRAGFNNRCLEISLKSRLAHCLWHGEDKTAAEDMLQNVWTIWRDELSEDEKLKTLKINIDELHYQKGDYKKALACLQEHFDIVRSHPHLEAYPITLYKMARVHLKLKHWETAEEQLLTSLAEMKKRRSLQWLSHVYNELGILYKKKGEIPKALENYRHAFELQRTCKKDVSLFLIAQNLGSLHLEIGEIVEAEKFFLYCQRHLQNHTQHTLAKRSLSLCHLGLCQIETARRNFAFARLHLQNAYKCLQKFKLDSLWQTHWQLKGTLDFAENNVLELQEDLAKLKHLQSQETFDHDNFAKWHNEIWGDAPGSSP